MHKSDILNSAIDPWLGRNSMWMQTSKSDLPKMSPELDSSKDSSGITTYVFRDQALIQTFSLFFFFFFEYDENPKLM